MVPASMVPLRDTPPPSRSWEKTKLDRWGQRIRSLLSKKGDRPRVQIVRELVKYLKVASERFPGDPEPSPKYKVYSSGYNVLNDLPYAELTRVGYRGHFAMMSIRDEFPSGFFTLVSTELGPKLVLSGLVGDSVGLVAEVCIECC